MFFCISFNLLYNPISAKIPWDCFVYCCYDKVSFVPKALIQVLKGAIYLA